jgi:hypothetical protein
MTSGVFFDSRYGGYVLDDEFISSKVSEIEHKAVGYNTSNGIQHFFHFRPDFGM